MLGILRFGDSGSGILGFWHSGKSKFCSPVLVVAVLACRRFVFQKKHVPGILDVISVIPGFSEIKQRRGISPGVGPTHFQPVMFDMDPFGGKKVC